MPDDGNSRALTPAELRNEFMDSCRNIVDYWASEEIAIDRSVHGRLSGALHSFLCLIDGVSSGFPSAITLVADPHPDDKEYRQGEGENWVEPGTEINKDDHLHELIYGQGSWQGRPLGRGGRAGAGNPVAGERED